MKYNIKRDKGSYEDTIAFLNSSAKSFYNRKTRFEYGGYHAFFKSIILSALIDIERVIRGTFNCDIFMKYARYDLLKQMFPNGMKLFKVTCQDEIVNAGRFFDILRNATAHAYCSERDYVIFDWDYSHLKDEKKFNQDILYEKDGRLTIAGLIFLIFNFLRAESIITSTKQDNLFGIVAFGSRMSKGNLDEVPFVSEISRANLEVPIRTIAGNTVIEAITDYYYDTTNKDEFDIKVGTEYNPTFSVQGQYKDNELVIKAGSLSKTYYHNDYHLVIEKEKEFIKLSSQLPAMTFVDLLYLMNINVFNQDAYEKVLVNFERLYLKLNYPKFYVDKNVNIILLPKEIADFRMISKTISSGLLSILINLEENIIYAKKVDKKKLSKLSTLLKLLDVSNDVKCKTAALRNFVAHGYLLDEYIINDYRTYQFTLDFVLKTLIELIDSLKDEDTVVDHLKQNISNSLISKVCISKYKQCVEASRIFMETYPEVTNEKDLVKKNLFVNHSFFDTRIFNELNNACLKQGIINYIELKNYPQLFLCIYQNPNDEEAFNRFIDKNNLKIVKSDEQGLITYYLLD